MPSAWIDVWAMPIHHRAGFGFDDSGLDVPAATAELDKNWVHGVA